MPSKGGETFVFKMKTICSIISDGLQIAFARNKYFGNILFESEKTKSHAPLSKLKYKHLRENQGNAVHWRCTTASN